MAESMDAAEKCLKHFIEGEKDEAIAILSDIDNPGQLRDKERRTLLHLAARHKGWLDIVRILIDQYHIDPMCTNMYGATPLHNA